LDSSSSLETLTLYAGGKATNLAKLEKAMMPVPHWFCLSTKCFEEYCQKIKTTNLDHAQIEAQFLALEFSPEFSQFLEQKIKQMKQTGSTFAVRSSAVGEDSSDNSFAGQFSSYLYQESLEQITSSIKRCWASAFNDRAIAYLKDKNLEQQPIKMAVIIQEMINAEKAGVAFSRNPINPLKRDEMIISAVYGAGEGLVSGELDADTYYLNRRIEEKLVTSSEIASKDYFYSKNQQGGLLKQALPSHLKSEPVLNLDEIGKLSKYLIAIENAMSEPQDIEWVIAGEKIYLVQARPITNFPPNSFFDVSVVGGKYILWDNSNITESYSGITSPLTFSHISKVYRQVYIQFCEVMGVPKQLIQAHDLTFRNMLGLVRGRVYYNLRNWYHMLFLFPASSKSNSFMETMMGVKQNLKPEMESMFDFTKSPPNYSLPRKLYILGVNLVRILKVNKIIQDFKYDFDKIYQAGLQVNYNQMNVQELLDYYDYLNTEFVGRWKAPIISDTRCMIFFGVLKALTEKWIKDDSSNSLHNDLLSGGGDLPSTEPTRLLMKLAEKILKSPQKQQEWFLNTATTDILKTWQDETTSDIAQDFKKFIHLYGFRCVNELKLESTDLHEDASFAIEAIRNFVRMKNVNVDEIIKNEKEKCAKAEAIVKNNISGIKAKIFFFILKKTRLAVKDREDLRLLRTNSFGLCRRIFKSLGQCYHKLGLIAEPMDIFYLSIDEIIGYQEGRAFEVNFLELTQLRKKQFREYAKTTAPPDRFVTSGVTGINFKYPATLEDLLAKDAPVSDDPNVLIGTPCSPGVVEGIVRVVRDISEANDLNGEIMVAERTDPGWVPLFPSTSGLLIERGSLLSHSAIVARELGIPTIVGVHGGLMKRLKTGMKVKIDASKGTITILENKND